MTYYKYTTGSAFTLNGNDYIGYFNMTNGIPYTGRSKTSSSLVLEPTRTFLAKCYMSLLHFDATTTTTRNITALEYSPRNLLSTQILKHNLDILDQNNRLLFALTRDINAIVFDFVDNNDNTGFFGLSSTTLDIRNNDDVFYKDLRTDYHIDPFYYADETKFGDINKLDDTQSGHLVVYDDDVFNYIATTTTGTYTLSGTFKRGSDLKLISQTNIPGTERTIYNEKTRSLYNIYKSGNFYYIDVYDSDFAASCETLILKNKIKLDSSNIITDTLKITDNIIGYVSVEGRKYYCVFLDTSTFNVIRKYEFDTLPVFDIRDIDDNVIILTKQTEEEYLFHFIENIKLTRILTPIAIRRYITVPINDNTPLKFRVTFDFYDSNMFYIIEGNNFSARFISSPYTPAGVMSPGGLMMPPDLLFSTLEQRFDQTQYKFDTNFWLSNRVNILSINFAAKDDKNYLLLHNTGRIYFKKITRSDELANLPSFYDGDIRSCNANLKINVNMHIQNVLRDTLNIYTNLQKIRSVVLRDGVPLLGDYKPVPIVDINLRDFYFHDNESTNYVVINRVFSSLYNIQKTIYNTIVSE